MGETLFSREKRVSPIKKYKNYNKSIPIRIIVFGTCVVVPFKFYFLAVKKPAVRTNIFHPVQRTKLIFLNGIDLVRLTKLLKLRFVEDSGLT